MKSIESIDEAFIETVDSLDTDFDASNDQGQANNKHSILKTQMDRISLYESTISNSAKICRPIIEGIERSIRQVILRFYIHHKFYPALDEGGSSFFLLNIEGHLLDGKLRKIGKAVKFSNFFDKIEVHVEKKATASLVYTWKRDKSGVEVDGIKIKVFAEKLTLCKIGLFRRNLLTLRNRFVRFRYCEISPKLRQLLPNLRTDPSEDEVLLAVWQYITDRDLFGDKDHKIIRCDELLKGILQTDSFLVSYLRGKLAPHILGEKPVLVEHYLDPLNTESFLNPPNEDDDRPSSSTSSRMPLAQLLGRGGASRVVDLEVDLAENDMHSTTRLVKDLRNREIQCDENVAKLRKRLAYILRVLQEKVLLASRSPLPLSPALVQEMLSGVSAGREQPSHYTPRYLFDLLTYRQPAENQILFDAQKLRQKRMRDLDAASTADALAKDTTDADAHADLKRKREEREAMEKGREMQLVQWPHLQSDRRITASALSDDRELSSSLSLSRGGGSAVHVFDGFLDVGEDSLFCSPHGLSAGPAPWLQPGLIAAVSKPAPTAPVLSEGSSVVP